MKHILIRRMTLLFLLCIFASCASRPKESVKSTKMDDIKYFMELSQAGELGIQAMEQMLNYFQKNLPSVPDIFWKEFMSEVSPNELVDMVIPIYDKHFTHDDIKELIKFYSSPIGKKFIKVQPQLTYESMEVGQEWGRRLSEKIVKRITEAGYR
jgi:uncharacterized protein